MSDPQKKTFDPNELRERLSSLRARFDEFRGVFDLAGLRRRHDALEAELTKPDLWNDPENARKVGREKSVIESELGLYERIESGLDDVEVLLELADEAEDEETRVEAADRFSEIESDLGDAELRQLLGGEYDASDAIVSINSGAGGTDACDWAEMLMRMYLRWAERRGFRAEVLDLQPAEEAGIRGATIGITGDYAYGYLNTEQGVHRLVRISPFDANARRQTAFASVTAVPEIDDDVEVELDEADLRIDTYRASGAGGQHVNKTDSAVRITHLPTGVVVQCQNERSQHKNKATAMKVLRAQLFERSRREQQEKMAAIVGEKREIGFGSQIRSYTLHPQQRVKDHRTDSEMGNADAVLDGEIDGFMRATLLQQSVERGAKA
ncbi:MAG: peptide chain release factor 2 [Deltaproteobacteria bacterium]|nr:peptide chain release factor 2 [Deltaproteobacteria bacterium]